MVPPQCGGTGSGEETRAVFSRVPQQGGGDGRNMLRPYGFTCGYASQRGWREGGQGSYSWG